MWRHSKDDKSEIGTLIIDRDSSSDQLLVSVCRNKTYWLSPNGWSDLPKVTLLDSYSDGQITKIIIPLDHVEELNEGDKLFLRCSELDYEAEFLWAEASDVSKNQFKIPIKVSGTIREARDWIKNKVNIEPIKNKRLKNSHYENMSSEEENLTDVAVSNYIPESLKDRQMENEQEEAQRKIALRRYEAALEISHHEDTLLRGRLQDLQVQLDAGEDNKRDFTQEVDIYKQSLAEHEANTMKHFKEYDESASKLDVIMADLSIIQSDVETLKASRHKLSITLSNAHADNQYAQEEAEVALTRAKEKRNDLEKLRKEESDVAALMTSMSETLSEQNQIAAKAAEETQGLQLKYEKIRNDFIQAQKQIETIEEEIDEHAANETRLIREIEATELAIQDGVEREALQREIIAHLEVGGSVKDISGEKYNLDDVADAGVFSRKDDITAPALLLEEQPAISLENSADTAYHNVTRKEPSLTLKEDKGTGKVTTLLSNLSLMKVTKSPQVFFATNRNYIMIGGGIICALILIKASYAFWQPRDINLNAPSILDKTSTASSNLDEEIIDPNIMSDADISENASNMSVKTKKTEETDSTIIETPSTEAVVPRQLVKQSDSKALENSEVPAALTQPQTKINKDSSIEVKPEAISPRENKVGPLANQQDAPQAKKKPKSLKPEPSKPDVLKVNTPKANDAEVSSTNSLALARKISDVQMRLANINLYDGTVTGVQDKKTTEAIERFKLLFSMPVNPDITSRLLEEIKGAEERQEAEMESAQINSAVVTQEEDSFKKNLATVQAPIVRDSNIIEATLKINELARYPEDAWRSNYKVNVIVVISYDIDSEGRVSNLAVVSNDYEGPFADAFEREALALGEKLDYLPKTIGGVAAATTAKQRRIVFRSE